MKRRHHGFRSILALDIEQFIAYKRALGRCYQVEEKTLALFDDYLIEQHISRLAGIRVDLVDAFLRSRPRSRPRSYNHLRCTLGRLFSWMVAQGRLDSTPLQSPPKRATSPRQPFIFDAANARRLLNRANTLHSQGGTVHRGQTYYTLFAILYGLGLRVGEACRLRIRDVEFERRLLIIRESKFYKSRLVPFGPRIDKLLKAYLQIRGNRAGDLSLDAPLFTLRGGRAIHPGTVSQTFHHLLPHLALDSMSCSSPRLHDLRHSFAVGRLVRWYRAGADPQAHLLALSTFLGHVDVNSTAVYLMMTSTLLQEANRRFETFASPRLEEELGS